MDHGLKTYTDEEIFAESNRRRLENNNKTDKPLPTETPHHDDNQHAIICSMCGKPDKVPFKPKEGWTVKCRECYKRVNFTK